MGQPSGPSKTAQTAHGTVYFYEGEAASRAVMASMLRLELAKAAQRQQLMDALKEPTIQGNPAAAGVASAVAEMLELIISSVSASAAVNLAASSAAIGIAGLAMQAPKLKSDTLQISVMNKTEGPVVPVSCQAQASSTVEVAGPIEPGQTSKVVVVGENSGPMSKGNSGVDMNFLAGSNVANSGSDPSQELVGSSVLVEFQMRFSGQGHWRPACAIDGSGLYKMGSTEPSFAAYFEPTQSNIAGFTVSSMGLETPTGQGYICFLPSSAVDYG